MKDKREGWKVEEKGCQTALCGISKNFVVPWFFSQDDEK